MRVQLQEKFGGSYSQGTGREYLGQGRGYEVYTECSHFQSQSLCQGSLTSSQCGWGGMGGHRSTLKCVCVWCSPGGTYSDVYVCPPPLLKMIFPTSCIRDLSRLQWRDGFGKVPEAWREGEGWLALEAAPRLSAVAVSVSSAGDHQGGGAALRGAGQSTLRELRLRPGALLLRDLRRGDQWQGSHLPGPPLHRLPAALQRLHLG